MHGLRRYQGSIIYPPAAPPGWMVMLSLFLLSYGVGYAFQRPEISLDVLWQKAVQQNPMSDSARIYLGEVIRLAEKSHDIKFAAEGHYHLGRHYFLLMQTGPAREHFLEAHRLYGQLEDWEKTGFTNVQLGVNSIQENALDSAITFFQQAITLYTDHNLAKHLWTPYLGISNAHRKAGNIPAAFRYARQAVASLHPSTDRTSKAIAYKHILRLARDHDSLQVHAAYAGDLLTMYSPMEINDEVLQHIDHFVNIEDPLARIDAIQKSIDRLMQWPPTLELVSSYYQLGQTYVEVNDLPAALSALHTAYRIEKDSLQIVYFTPLLLRALSTQYQALGQYPQALDYYWKYEAVKDSLLRENIKTRTEELQLQFETRVKDEQIANQQQLVRHRTSQRNLITAFGAVLLLTAAYVFYVQRRHLKDQKVIADQQETLHENEIMQLKKQHEVAGLQMLVTTQEEERRRIAQDLHDSLGALLATLRNKTHRKESSGETAMSDQLKLIDAVNAEVRRIAYDMMPPALDRLGLSAAIDDLAATLQQFGQMKVSYQNIDYDQALDREKEITLYRIVQELCTNTVKHADASALLIQLSRHNGLATLVVEDNGKGFDTHSTHHRGMGLAGISTRVEYLQGTMEILTSPGDGTSITINVPVP